MAQGLVRGLIEIWELVVVVIFFLSVLSAILFVFDEQEFEKTLFLREFEEVISIMPHDSSLTMTKPDFIEVEKTTQGFEFSIKDEDSTTTIDSTREINLNTQENSIILTS